jgi:hypothetical protein
LQMHRLCDRECGYYPGYEPECEDYHPECDLDPKIYCIESPN